MIDLRWEQLEGPEGPVIADPVCLTIGVFDGVHRGHRELISQVTRCADARAAVITFDRHPEETLRGEQFRGYLTTPRQKRERLATLGVELVVGIDFSYQFSRMSGTEFLGKLLRWFSVRRVVVGHDFACGHQMDTNATTVAELLRPRGVEVIVVDPIRFRGAVLSSSLIRGMIDAGELASAREYLGTAYEIDVREAYGPLQLQERAGGLSTGEGQIVPPPGRYTGYLRDSHTGLRSEIVITRESIAWSGSIDDSIEYVGLEERTEGVPHAAEQGKEEGDYRDPRVLGEGYRSN